MKHLFVNLLLTILVLVCIEARDQWLTVRGRARCGLGQAPDEAAPIFIKLIDEDSGRIDDDMDETYASKDSGAFQLRGFANDPLGGTIDPEVHFYHKCKGRDKRVKMIIPREAIGKEYNFTDIINLQGNFQHEDDKTYPVRKCSSLAKKPKRRLRF